MSDTRFTPGPHYAVEFAGFYVMKSTPFYDTGVDLLNTEECPEAMHNALLYASAPNMINTVKTLLEENKRLKEESAERLKKLQEASLEIGRLQRVSSDDSDGSAKAKDLVKSFLSIAQRKGESTHWDGVIMQCNKILGVSTCKPPGESVKS